ncbi:hypothetical protein D3C86_1465910 [compost metagenome]
MLQVLDVDLVGLGDGRQVVARLDPIASLGGNSRRRLAGDFFENPLLGLEGQQLFGFHVRQAGGQQLRLGGGYQQLLGAIDRDPFLVRRVELHQFVFIDLGQFRHA